VTNRGKRCSISVAAAGESLGRENPPLAPPSGFICILRQVTQQLKERRRLADEESHGRQEVHHAQGNALCLSGSNDRTCRELAAEERARLWHDQLSLKIFAAKRWRCRLPQLERTDQLSPQKRPSTSCAYTSGGIVCWLVTLVCPTRLASLQDVMAMTRKGLPEPPAIFRGAAMTMAPVGGS